MQPPIEGTADELVRRNIAQVGEHFYTCGCIHGVEECACHEGVFVDGAFSLVAKMLWFRMTGLVDPGSVPVRYAWRDRLPDGSLGPPTVQDVADKRSLLGWMRAPMAPRPQEIHWFAVCRACLDKTQGDPTAISPRAHVELSDQPPIEFVEVH